MERKGDEKETSRSSKKNSHRRWNSLLSREIAGGFLITRNAFYAKDYCELSIPAKTTPVSRLSLNNGAH
jgi:hypothetical protein